MPDLQIFNSKTARATFYMLFVGGLFALLSASLAYIWEAVIILYFDLPAISFLEAGGIIAFFYIVAFGIRFGLKKNAANMSDVDLSDSPCHNIQYTQSAPECLNHLSESEREHLSQVLAKCCGIRENPANGMRNIQRQEQTSHLNV